MRMEANTIIEKLGGTGVVADMCQVTDQAVSQWRTNGIPPARLMYLKVIHPEVFSAPAAEQHKKAA